MPMRLKSPDGAVIADPVRRVAPCFDSVSAGCPDERNQQHPAASRRAAMVRTQGADGWAGYASHSAASRLPRIPAGNPGVGWITLRLPVMLSFGSTGLPCCPLGVPHYNNSLRPLVVVGASDQIGVRHQYLCELSLYEKQPNLHR